jgi:hypothetical protein
MTNEHKRYQKKYPEHLETIKISCGIAKQIDDLNEQLHKCELNGKLPLAEALNYDLKELSKQLVLPLLSIWFCKLTLECNIYQELVLKLSL